MSNAILSLVLDITILACLGGTIYYAFRLTNALSNFRDHRKDLQGLMTDLTENIDRAVKATEILKATSVSTGQELQETINEAKMLRDEMVLINEASENLANRLEGSAGGRGEKRVSADDLEGLFSPSSSDESEGGSFAIQDRDFDDDESGPLWEDEMSSDQDAAHLQSQAEKDLYQALQGKGKKRSSA